MTRSVRDGSDESLVVGVTSSEGVKANPLSSEIDFGSDETMGPTGIDEKLMSEQLNDTAIIGSTEINDSSLKGRLKIQTPVLGNRSPCGGAVDARSRALSCRCAGPR